MRYQFTITGEKGSIAPFNGMLLLYQSLHPTMVKLDYTGMFKLYFELENSLPEWVVALTVNEHFPSHIISYQKQVSLAA